ncbi:hypothetical protein M413DRAFT_442668 [Hebeloma cylindrosporum]|uniref:GAR domain-containing protein n=1 Tax=Hebeloma cylindrosporum TaxID=76867 RepID=A0A0C2YUN4_HEBCY|nr:hypothetical protein M413DRAFT_442668 [Hebeloma cylindrosporum h7]
MAAMSVASSKSSLYSSPSQSSLNYILPSPTNLIQSFGLLVKENVTITANRSMSKKVGKQKSHEDIRLLAISTHMTELSYAISDIQTRIFEIQELRHKSQSAGDNADATTTTIIDQSLMTLDERRESVENGIKNINETLEPLLRTATTPTVSENGKASENAAILRKHSTLLSEWESVQDESEVLREELKEDKWLTVFRTVTDQADGMMSSLEKAVNHCQEFIWQVHRRGAEEFQSNAALPSVRSDKPPATFEMFTSLLDSYEAKKKHYMPATSKVLSIIDKGVRDRVTKNGETLRRHAESAQRWKNLRERITRTDAEMEAARKILLGDFSDQESTTSGTASTKNGYLATPPSGSRASKVSSSASLSISGSISPFRKFARKITGNNKPVAPPITPLAVNKKVPVVSSEPSSAVIRRQRTSLFGSVRGSAPVTPSTPERPSHKHSQSYTPDSSPRAFKLEKTESNLSASSRGTNSHKQRWNSSTKVEQEERNSTIKGTPRRPPSSTGYFSHYNDDIPPVPPIGTPSRRSLSRVSMASSRPWSPVTSSNSTTYSSSYFNQPVLAHALRTPSRAQTPSRAITPGLATTPRTRPKTPSHIPGPAKNLKSISGARSVGGWDDEDQVFNRSFSPAFSTSALSSTSPHGIHPPRPPSRSMIPVPSVHLHTPSRPSSSLSNFSRSESPTMRFRNTALRAQTPEHTLRSRAQQVPVYQGSVARPRTATNKLPPSSFRDGSGSRVPSRPGSRSGAYTPSMDQLPLHEYIPGNNFDPLDVEVATVVNSLAHGLLVERVDPPLRKSQIPKEGEEIKAQYAFSNTLSRKVITCRLTTLTRSGKTGGDTTTKKVMCRVGGGWQDLSHYILNRQAGLG